MRAICVVLLDGVGDRSYPELGGRSANEAAVTPSLDALCARGSCGLLWPLGPGRAPSSERAHWAMLGYRDDEFPGRAVLEARGRGIGVSAEHVYGYAALRSVTVDDAGLRVTGRIRDDRRVPELMHGGSVERDGVVASCSYVGGGEGVLQVRGRGVDDRITDSDPFFRDRDPVLRPVALVPEAEPTAAAVAGWMRATLDRAGDTGTIVTVKWWGRPRPSPTFAERHGLAGAVIAASPFHAGLAATLEMAFHPHPESEDLTADLRGRLETAAGLLEAGTDFVLIHHKGSDEAGHTKDPLIKVAATEAFDGALERLAAPPFDDAVVCVTGDHATPASPDVIHSGDPVPLAVAGPGVRADRTTAWGELSCREGILGHLWGADLMHVLLNAADRALFAGSRPTRAAFAAGHPSNVEAFEA